MNSGAFAIEAARPEDARELNDLYFSVYGSDYPLKKGIEYRETREALSSSDTHHWLIVRSPEGRIAGSCIFEKEPDLKIGKVSGVVVHEDYRGQGLSKALITEGTRFLLYEKQSLHSLYTTTRTVSVAPQLMFLKNGFIPLGLFPNAHKLRSFETVTLMGVFSPNVLEKRARVLRMPLDVASLAEIVNRRLSMRDFNAKTISMPEVTPSSDQQDSGIRDYEFIYASDYVGQRFQRRFRRDSEAGFYPFHRPNLMICSASRELEIYAYYNQKDHYCVLVASNKTLRKAGLFFSDLLKSMKSYGISYVELMIRLSHHKSVAWFLEAGFIPSALYPAMWEEEGVMHDFLLLTQTMEPLDFKGMHLHESFHPFMKLYTSRWIHKHIDALEVYHDISH